jgi:hypothetical protein
MVFVQIIVTASGVVYVWHNINSSATKRNIQKEWMITLNNVFPHIIELLHWWFGRLYSSIGPTVLNIKFLWYAYSLIA